jgi:hypothetical protein
VARHNRDAPARRDGLLDGFVAADLETHVGQESPRARSFGTSPGVTFPLNIMLGTPLYTSVAVAVPG